MKRLKQLKQRPSLNAALDLLHFGLCFGFYLPVAILRQLVVRNATEAVLRRPRLYRPTGSGQIKQLPSHRTGH
jgi:hypothetical protein